MSTPITCHGDEIDTTDSSGSYSISYSDGTTTTIDLSALTSATSSSTVSCISTITLPTSSYGTSGFGSITIGGGGGAGTNYNTCYTWANPISTSNVNIGTDGIKMEEGTDIKIGDRSLKEFMLKMEERMAILVPDPKKLEKFAALKKAYDNYKLLEKLCQEEDKEDKQ